MPYRDPFDFDEGDLFTGTRICKRCEGRQPMDAFYWSRKPRARRRTCKACVNERQAELRAQKPEAYAQSSRDYALRRKYGLTSEEVATMAVAQEGKCAICTRALGDLYHVDHSHETGAVRGLLCAHCNVGLGHFFDDPALLAVAHAYLLKHNAEPGQRVEPQRLTDDEIAQAHREAALAYYDTPGGKENRRRKSWQTRGENNVASRLRREDVLVIRQRLRDTTVSQRALAREYDVAPGTINQIALGRTWKHLLPDTDA